MMAAALAMVSCVKTEMKPLDPQNPIFPVANVVEMTTLTSSEATKDEEGRRIFTLDLTDGATPMHLTLVGSKYYLTANQYTEALEAVAKNGNFVLGKSSIAGKNIKQGYINVDVLEEVETEEGCDNAYKISAVLFLEDGTPYKANWTGRISFEKDPILGPQFHYTDTIAQDCTDAGGTLYTDVESHTLVLNDLEGNFAAQIKLIRSVGAKDLSGEYTVAEYAHEDFTAGNGFDMTPFGWPVVIGSYYLDADGNNVIIEPGAKISVTKAGEGGFYSIDGDGFSFLCAPEGYIPGILIYDSTDTVAQDCTDAGGTLYEDVESHTIVLTDAADATVAQIKLIRAVGTTDLTGVYTVAEYAHEDFTAGNGFDMTPYGWPVVIGTYYYDEEGNVVIVEPGETITVTSAGQDTYKFEGSTGWTFVAVVEVPTPEPPQPQGIVIDGDPSDWVGVENVVTLELPDGAELTALQSAKVLYSDKIYILAQLSDEALADGKIRLHVYFDTDETGKAQQKWVDADIDYMLEGKMTNSGAFVPYSSSFYKWNGTEPGDWAWTDSGTELGLEGAGADHYYELAIDYTNYPGGLPEQFPIGLDVVYTDWAIHGYLPQTNHKLVIKKDGIAPQPSDEPAGITIDGDMSDWADIEGAVNEEGAAYAEFKVTSDANNIYFYARRSSTKFADLWNGGGYLYFAFDTDNDATTGTGEIWGNGPYECIFVIWPFAGSSAEPAFAASPLGESQMKPSGKLDNYIADGVFDSATGVELEFSIPRADMPALPETEISIFSWGNKSGESMKNVPLKVTL